MYDDVDGSAVEKICKHDTCHSNTYPGRKACHPNPTEAQLTPLSNMLKTRANYTRWAPTSYTWN